MAALTYKVISSQTLNSDTATVTFNSIPATYTDLVLKMTLRTTNSTNDCDVAVRFNGDTGANYAWNQMYATSGGIGGNSTTTATSLLAGNIVGGGSYLGYVPLEMNIFNYAQTTMYKGTLHQGCNAHRTVVYLAGNWRNTNAISSITISIQSGDIASGSILTIYGITKE